nr:C2H2-type zinc finger protein [Candidatus Sigynarchaeota archaeon]
MLCTFCKKDFKGKGGLTNHVRVNHPAEYNAQLAMEIKAMQRRIEFLNTVPREKDPEPEPGRIDPAAQALAAMAFYTREKEAYTTSLIEMVGGMDPGSFPGGSLVRDHMLAMNRLELNEIREKIKTLPTIKLTESGVKSLQLNYNFTIDKTKERIEGSKSDVKQRDEGGYTCKFCGKAFKSKGSHTSHVRSDHPTEYDAVIEEEERTSIAERQKKDQEFAKEHDFPAFVQSKAQVESMLRANVARRKIDLYLLHGRFDDALTQLKIEIAVSIGIEKQFHEEQLKDDLLPASEYNDEHQANILNIVENCINGFKSALERYSKKKPILQSTLDKLTEVKTSFLH